MALIISPICSMTWLYIFFYLYTIWTIGYSDRPFLHLRSSSDGWLALGSSQRASRGLNASLVLVAAGDDT